jgi:hypothetical protein
MIIYHHVPKCGGSYVIRALVASMRAAGWPAYGNFRVTFGDAEPDLAVVRAHHGMTSSHWAYGPERKDEGGRVKDEGRGELDGRGQSLNLDCAGSVKIARNDPGDLYLSWVRDPVEMFFSAWEFYRSPLSSLPWTRCERLREQIGRVFPLEKSFEAYVEECWAPGVEPYPLGQVPWVPTERGFGVAADWVAAFDFVGCVERMEPDLAELCERLGIELVLPARRENVSPRTVDRERWRPEVEALLRMKLSYGGTEVSNPDQTIYIKTTDEH